MASKAAKITLIRRMALVHMPSENEKPTQARKEHDHD